MHSVPRRLAAAAILLALLVAGHVSAQSDFLSGFGDLPLMPGLQEQQGASVSFDTPYGRIVEGVASGSTTTEEVLAFYDETLPALGWQRTGSERFRRDNEVLTLSFARDAGRLVVRFSLVPPQG
ncbi:MAG: hypothetical protein WD270_12365 [Acetobacterales bacterium]